MSISSLSSMQYGPASLRTEPTITQDKANSALQKAAENCDKEAILEALKAGADINCPIKATPEFTRGMLEQSMNYSLDTKVCNLPFDQLLGINENEALKKVEELGIDPEASLGSIPLDVYMKLEGSDDSYLDAEWVGFFDWLESNVSIEEELSLVKHLRLKVEQGEPLTVREMYQLQFLEQVAFIDNTESYTDQHIMLYALIFFEDYEFALQLVELNQPIIIPDWQACQFDESVGSTRNSIISFLKAHVHHSPEFLEALDAFEIRYRVLAGEAISEEIAIKSAKKCDELKEKRDEIMGW